MKASLTETKAMILDKKATTIETQASMNFEGHQREITDAVKVLGVIIDDKLTFCQQYTAATNGAIQTIQRKHQTKLFEQPID